MRVAIALLLMCGVAEAGAVKTPKQALAAARRAGWKHGKVVASGDVWVISSGGRLVLVDPASGKVIETGDPDFAFGEKATWSVTATPFFGRDDLSDVAVSAQWSNGMGGGDAKVHYIVRANGWKLACTFEDTSDSSMEDASSTHQVTIVKVSDDPLRWTLSTIDEDNHPHGGSGTSPAPQTITYTLKGSGRCTHAP
jgi:hypothetical protein